MNTFDEVLEQYEPMISAVIRKLNIYQDFEQFRQAGRVALWQAWTRFDERKGNFTPFAYRSIHGALLDELKKENRFSEVHTPVEDNIVELMGTGSLETTDESDLGQVVAELNLEERQLLSILFVDNWSQAKCAEFFGITVAGVKKRRERLLKKLKLRLMELEAQI
ncbi:MULTISPECIES: sigma-70 family RNA polymerase sigma factor [Sporosarcina]|nr:MULTISPECIES: sigma-70 family RNA polymerase sigma factor [Sporosarcina]MBY0221627.1 sigma-70 family RNA polymerase sigma factor [Sporosarcina aquimarina]